jgi:prefoldin subunit 5
MGVGFYGKQLGKLKGKVSNTITSISPKKTKNDLSKEALRKGDFKSFGKKIVNKENIAVGGLGAGGYAIGKNEGKNQEKKDTVKRSLDKKYLELEEKRKNRNPELKQLLKGVKPKKMTPTQRKVFNKELNKRDK